MVRALIQSDLEFIMDLFTSIFLETLKIMLLSIALLIVIHLVIMIIESIPRAKLFIRAGYPWWQAFIPFVRTFVFAKIIGREPWLFLLATIGLNALLFKPFLGDLLWPLGGLLAAWMCYDLALIFGRSKTFSIIFASFIFISSYNDLSYTTFNYPFTSSFNLDLETIESGSIDSYIILLLFLIKLCSIGMWYLLAFTGDVTYGGPRAKAQERLFMDTPWITPAWLNGSYAPSPAYSYQRQQAPMPYGQASPAPDPFNGFTNLAAQPVAPPPSHQQPTYQQPTAQQPSAPPPTQPPPGYLPTQSPSQHPRNVPFLPHPPTHNP